MKKPGSFVVSIDRIEGATVVAEADDGRQFEAPIEAFTARPREGMIFRVFLDAAGEPDWPNAVADRAEAAKRKADLANRMNALRKRDPGGDIGL